MKWSLKLKILGLLIVFAIVPSVLLSIVSARYAQETTREQIKNKLTLANSLKRDQMNSFYESMQNIPRSLASDPRVVESFLRFKEGFYSEPLAGDERASEQASQFYSNVYASEFNKRNGISDPVQVKQYWSDLDARSLHFQRLAIFENTHGLGEKHRAHQLGNSTAWSIEHQQKHGYFTKIVEDNGLYDLFLVDTSGRVIYSVFKECDFAANLTQSNLKSSALAHVYEEVVVQGIEKALSPIEKYFPSYLAPAQFVASPLKDSNGAIIGAVIIQVPLQKLNALMSDSQQWKEKGYGETGETFLTRGDGVLISDTREVLTQFDGALERSTDFGLDAQERASARTQKTFSLSAQLSPEQIRLGFHEDILFGKSRFYSVQSSQFSDQSYLIVTQMDVEEGLNHKDLYLTLGGLLLLSFTIISVLAYIFGSRLSQFILSYLENLYAFTQENGKWAVKLKDEADQVNLSSSEQAAAIQQTVTTLDEISSMVSRNVEIAEISNQATTDAVESVREGQSAVAEREVSVNEISNSSRSLEVAAETNKQDLEQIIALINNIRNKTQVINDIVFQTKLLSFNASVEAARGGEHGKGFAVVAEEVGTLADNSGQAAQEIQSLLHDSIEKVNEVVSRSSSSLGDIVRETQGVVERGQSSMMRFKGLFDKILTSSQKVSEHMDQIRRAAEEQSTGVHNISLAMQKIDEITSAHHEISKNTVSLSHQLQESSQKSQDNVVEFRNRVRGAA